MKAAFDTFDLDKSRKLEKREVRLILEAMYPNLSRKQALNAMREVKEDEIPFEDFAECVEKWHESTVNYQEPPRAKRRSLLERLGFVKKVKKGMQDTMKKTQVASAFCAAGTGRLQIKSEKAKLLAAAVKSGKAGDIEEVEVGFGPARASIALGHEAPGGAGIAGAFAGALSKAGGDSQPDRQLPASASCPKPQVQSKSSLFSKLQAQGSASNEPPPESSHLAA